MQLFKGQNIGLMQYCILSSLEKEDLVFVSVDKSKQFMYEYVKYIYKE